MAQRFSFKAKIYKVGINAVVAVPNLITKKLAVTKGYIAVKGTIENHPFQQTLCPVKNSEYRLYVNIPMLKGARKEIGNVVKFVVEQDDRPKTTAPEMLPEFERRLKSDKMLQHYHKLSLSKQKEILKYMSFLKSSEAITRNIEKVIVQLKGDKIQLH